MHFIPLDRYLGVEWLDCVFMCVFTFPEVLSYPP